MWATLYDTASLVLPRYARHVNAKEREAAAELLAQLRSYAHPDEAS